METAFQYDNFIEVVTGAIFNVVGPTNFFKATKSDTSAISTPAGMVVARVFSVVDRLDEAEVDRRMGEIRDFLRDRETAKSTRPL